MTKPVSTDEYRKSEIYKFLSSPQGSRSESVSALRTRLGIQRPTFNAYKARYKLEMETGTIEQGVARKVKEEADVLIKEVRQKAGKAPDNYDSEQYLRNNLHLADIGLIDSCKKGNANSLRVLAQRLGLIIEKAEMTHKLDGNDIARLALVVEKESRGEGIGMVEVQKKPDLLRDTLRLSSGQGVTEDS